MSDRSSAMQAGDERLLRIARRAARRAAEHPRAYLRELTLLALASQTGFAALRMLFLLPLALSLLSGEATWTNPHVLLGAAAMLLIGVRALLLRVPQPEGRRLSAGRAPRLFEQIETLRRRLDAKAIHTVLVDPQIGASIAQVPRLGLFGFPRPVLVLGLPLLCILSPAESRAVLAHELAHLSRRHMKLGNRVYRVGMMWDSLYQTFSLRTGIVARAMGRFVGWFASRFHAYSSALSVRQEYEADSVSAELAGRQEAARALVCMTAIDQQTRENYWSQLWQRAQREPTPPQDAISTLVSRARGLSESELLPVRDQLLRAASSIGDTHPSLAERLSALGVLPGSPVAASPSAAEEWFDDALPELLRELDRDWQAGAGGEWRERHARLAVATQATQRLEGLAAERPLNAIELAELAEAVELLGDRGQAGQLLERAVTMQPTHAAALYGAGRLRLAEDDDSGIGLVERAMELDESFRPEGCELLYRRALREGRKEEARRYWLKGLEVGRLAEEAQRERSDVARRDKLLSHEIPPQLLDHLRETFRRHRAVKRVWIVRKQVRRMPSVPAYVMVVKSTSFFRSRSSVLDRLYEDIRLEGSLTAFDWDEHRQIARRVRKAAGRPVYER